MDINFREIDPFNCWIWLKFAHPPSEGEKKYIDGLFDSWYVIGKLGGFNSENLQAHDAAAELSWITYEEESCMPALMHNLGTMEYQNEWGRCWVDLGTSDAMAFDILINCLIQINGDVVELKELVIGGVNDDWPVDDHPDAIFPNT
ncbi:MULTISPECIES: DUF3531 family protein [unclassified Prochlorococcus]|uniref:DUF3531 family protein n=1 Tax=unclassified Prochlorococcus TaxID=2627481 RepID=UPI000533B73C|nr:MULTISPECIES: DUF3531 family protein [unclassified Prochlorococcus]KGG15350.1 hypothetical protein EV06_1221 [Prochlorococcus sp. MIT 0602]KGG17628.1 hypothetical protein EV07_1068 [Prochlorococcus sp. MIT 0603]